MRDDGKLDGLGFAIENTGLVGIDLDKCITKGEVHPAAQEIVDRFNCYAEISPSRTGLRILLYGKKPTGAWSKTGKTGWGGAVECYDSGRYLTITGQHLNGSLPVAERQDALDWLVARYKPAEAEPSPIRELPPAPSLSDAELLEKARAAKNGNKFSLSTTPGTRPGTRRRRRRSSRYALYSRSGRTATRPTSTASSEAPD
jgi:primase-polymerase (primpol)-like protein